MKLSDVLDILAPLSVKANGFSKEDAQRSFSGVFLHSKQVQPGSLFIAIVGNQQDGTKYVQEAVERGASAIVTQIPLSEVNLPQILVSDTRAAAADLACAWFRYPAQKLDCIGITGTNGKTTTAYMLRSILEAAGRKVGMFGTVGYFLLDRAVPAPNTTPDALLLQAYLAELLAHGADSAVMEVSSHALTQSRTRGIPFRAAVFTNLSSEHLDYHQTLEDYFTAKARLFEDLPPNATAVINADDPVFMRLKGLTRASVSPFGIDAPEAKIKAKILESSLEGMHIQLQTPQGETRIRLALPGKHNVMNLLAASGAALSLGVSLEDISQGISRLKTVPGRLEKIEGAPFSVFVDYAHTDDALEKALRNLRPLTRGRLILVFGCGGDRDRSKRPRMGRVGTELANFTWITSDNPRREDPLAIIGEILVGVRSAASRYQVEVDRRKAIHRAMEMARPGDVVLIAGKGHENYQIIGNNSSHFDDREIAREAIRGTISS